MTGLQHQSVAFSLRVKGAEAPLTQRLSVALAHPASNSSSGWDYTASLSLGKTEQSARLQRGAHDPGLTNEIAGCH